MSLFWLEAVLIAFFAVFRVAQTWEQWGNDQLSPDYGERDTSP